MKIIVLLMLISLFGCANSIDLSSLPIYKGSHEGNLIMKGEQWIRCTDEEFSDFICFKSPMKINGIMMDTNKVRKFFKNNKITKDISFDNIPVYIANHTTQSVNKGSEQILCSDTEFSKMLCVRSPISLGGMTFGKSQVKSVIKIYGK